MRQKSVQLLQGWAMAMHHESRPYISPGWKHGLCDQSPEQDYFSCAEIVVVFGRYPCLDGGMTLETWRKAW
ncbi:Uncharacterized protein HZ326_21141 [Fusarium oxysporum f. sp. albedinis]|nr:Uncharacterized protein HZ326_21141 [Fusarium oxysporum f. sp. albedinis]